MEPRSNSSLSNKCSENTLPSWRRNWKTQGGGCVRMIDDARSESPNLIELTRLTLRSSLWLAWKKEANKRRIKTTVKTQHLSPNSLKLSNLNALVSYWWHLTELCVYSRGPSPCKSEWLWRGDSELCPQKVRILFYGIRYTTRNQISYMNFGHRGIP